jgi:hypothetical protein
VIVFILLQLKKGAKLMRTIRISDEVWNEIAKRGKFGETPDDVFKRIFEIPHNIKTRQRYARRRMSSRIKDGLLKIEFQDGPSNKWSISKGDNVNRIREVRKQALEFAKENKATDGQRQAVRNAFTDAGIYVTK